jgi:hypothetical protein
MHHPCSRDRWNTDGYKKCGRRGQCTGHSHCHCRRCQPALGTPSSVRCSCPYGSLNPRNKAGRRPFSVHIQLPDRSAARLHIRTRCNAFRRAADTPRRSHLCTRTLAPDRTAERRREHHRGQYRRQGLRCCCCHCFCSRHRHYRASNKYLLVPHFCVRFSGTVWTRNRRWNRSGTQADRRGLFSTSSRCPRSLGTRTLVQRKIGQQNPRIDAST